MEAYQELRLRARNKRDAAVREARNAYYRELAAIQALKNSLDGVATTRGPKANGVVPKRPISALVRQALPPAGTFTISDVCESLRRLDATRRYRRDSLRSVFSQLKHLGVVRRVSRLGRGQVLWECVPDQAPPATPFIAMQIPDAIGVVMRDAEPLRVPDIVLALQARGYRPDAPAKRLQESVRAALKRCGERFTAGEAGTWALAEAGRGDLGR